MVVSAGFSGFESITGPGEVHGLDFPMSFEVATNDVTKQIITTLGGLQRSVLVAVDGVDGVGKTRFSEAVGTQLGQIGYPVTVVHIDNFTNPWEVRHATESPVENYYQHTFDYAGLIRNILEPVNNGKAVDIDMIHPDPKDDSKPVRHGYKVPQTGGIVIVEGVFLLRPELAPYFDLKVLLDMPVDEMVERAKLRDVPIYGSDFLVKVMGKYVPAQVRYADEVRPQLVADCVYDFQDWKKPVLRKQSGFTR